MRTFRLTAYTLALLVGLNATFPPTVTAQEPSGVDERARGEYIHRESGTVFRTPAGWATITPNRLRKMASTTVMGLEKVGDSRLVSNVSFLFLGAKPYSEFISTNADNKGEFGEEHNALLTIYGASRVSKPESIRSGSYTMTKIRIAAGAIPEDQNVGLVYFFESGAGDKRWLVKVRVSVPSVSEVSYSESLNSLLNAFSRDVAR